MKPYDMTTENLFVLKFYVIAIVSLLILVVSAVQNYGRQDPVGWGLYDGSGR